MMNREKLKAMVHYVCWRCRDNPGRLGATKLNKVIWRVETRHYVETNGHSLTGARFIKEKNGPVVVAMKPLLAELEDEGVLESRKRKVFTFSRTEYLTKADPNTALLDQDEIRELDEAIDEICAMTADEASKATHTEPWELAEMGETIPLYAIMATPRPITQEDRDWANSVIASRFAHES